MQTCYPVDSNTPMPMMAWTPAGNYNTSRICPPQPCIPQEIVIRNVKLARAYVPFQKFCSIFLPEEALHKGTAFPELYQPYLPKETLKSKIIPMREEYSNESE